MKVYLIEFLLKYFHIISAWLACSEDAPDIFAIGLQEIDMSPDAIVRNETKIDYNWVAKIMEGLHPGDSYVSFNLNSNLS
jgi:hypothetical protein